MRIYPGQYCPIRYTLGRKTLPGRTARSRLRTRIAETNRRSTGSVMIKIYLSLVVLILSGTVQAREHPGSGEFIARAVQEYGLDAAELETLLANAEFKQSIVDAISRPAEGKPWYEYRPIFLTRQRISEGIRFWQDNHDLITRVSRQYGVDPQIIVAIIGVETRYGKITGSYRVLDALTTLGLYYPKDLPRDRSGFFSTELMQFIKLGKEENLPVTEVTGSYAGAMGMGQFIPSSYREYAVDFDGNGSRDLWRSTADVIASVANYLHRHGWKPGDPVTAAATPSASADPDLVSGASYKPELTVGELAQRGYRSDPGLSLDRPAAVLKLEDRSKPVYWLVFDNFYVITRYNRSPMYAMAVLQLSEEIRKGVDQS